MNFAIALTLFRFFASLTILPFVLLYKTSGNDIVTRGVALTFFLLLAATDFFDGYIARKQNTVSEFGAFLDPIADKCLVTVTIICLVSLQRMHVLFAIPMICREILVLSLRQYAAERGKRITVSNQGKIKTALQCIALGFAIVAPEFGVMLIIKNTLLCMATYFSIASFLQYGGLARELLV